MVTYTKNIKENLIVILFIKFYHDIQWVYIIMIKQ
jgi:hypothetical protein